MAELPGSLTATMADLEEGVATSPEEGTATSPAVIVGKRISEGKEGENKMRRARSGDSVDTIWEEAEGANEDDLEETTRGTKEETVFRKLDLLVTKKWGAKGSEKRPTVTEEEMKKHTSEEDFWVMINGMVFDMGPFLREEAKHPGGTAILLRQLELSGSDAGDRFVRWHNAAGNAVRRAPKYFVELLSPCLQATLTSLAPTPNHLPMG